MKFLLLIDMPIQNHAQQLEIYQVFNLLIPHRNLSACNNIDTKYLKITYDETKAVEILEQQFITCQQAIGQICSINAPHQPLANPPSCIAAIYAKDKAGIEKRCSLQIRNMNSATIPTPIAPYVGILTSAPKSVLTGIMLICPDKAPRFIKTQTPIHIHHLPPACSAKSQHFHLPRCYENHQLTINITLNTSSLGQHTISSYWSTLQAHDQQQWTHHSICFNWWVNRWYSISLDTIFSYRNLHNRYRIADTCRIRDILLLLFLVLTCHKECHSHSITVLDSKHQATHPQQCHIMSIHSPLLQ